LADGKLGREKALRWIRANRHSWLGGWEMRERLIAAHGYSAADAVATDTSEEWKQLAAEFQRAVDEQS
jgi:hypothetical protein